MSILRDILFKLDNLESKAKMIKRIRKNLVLIKAILAEENRETKQMLAIYKNFIKGESNKKEMNQANEQFRQILKNAGIGFLAIFPFAPITIPLVVYIGKILKFDVLPRSFRTKNGESKDSKDS